MFDYIVVGAGTAGCVLAARLTEDPQVNVLLMEAGPPDRAREIHLPLAFPKLFQSPLDWNFWTEPQANLGNRHLYWPRGKTLGGSGSLNAMVHMDPCAADLEPWRTPGWGPEDLRPLRDNVRTAGLSAEPLTELNPLTEAFLESCAAIGLPRARALEDASTPVAAPFRLNIDHGHRVSAAGTYLRPALRRGNLTVWTNVHVRRILTQGGRATGIEYSKSASQSADGPAVQTVAVTREIVLCAGAVGSPHLLLLSGIGPRAHLESLAIPVVADVPGVGANLQDHLAAPVAYFSLEPVSFSGAMTFKNRWKHRLRAKGPLASNGAEAGATFQSRPSLSACDLEIVFAAGHYVDHGFATPGGHGFSLIPVLLTPRSRGHLRLASPDPAVAPLIDPAYASDSADVAILAQGVLFARRVAEQKALTRYRGAPVQGRMLEPEEHIREWGQTLYHPAGTCKMGAGPDAVVDAYLRVHQVAGLRVADASIMPHSRAHINATTALIAENAARILRG